MADAPTDAGARADEAGAADLAGDAGAVDAAVADADAQSLTLADIAAGAPDGAAVEKAGEKGAATVGATAAGVAAAVADAVIPDADAAAEAAYEAAVAAYERPVEGGVVVPVTMKPVADGDRCPTKMFVGALGWNTSGDMLKEHFGQFGEVLDAIVMKDRDTKQSRGFGFVTLATTSAANRILEAKHVLEGRTLNLTLATPEGGAAPHDNANASRDNKKIYVANLHTATTEAELTAAFASFGPVGEIVVMRHSTTNESRGFGFVTFTHHADAVKCVAQESIDVGQSIAATVSFAQPRKERAPSSRAASVFWASTGHRLDPSTPESAKQSERAPVAQTPLSKGHFVRRPFSGSFPRASGKCSTPNESKGRL